MRVAHLAVMLGCAGICAGLTLHARTLVSGFTPTQARLIYGGIALLAAGRLMRPGGEVARLRCRPIRPRDAAAALVQVASWVMLLLSVRKLIHYAGTPRPMPIYWEIAAGFAAVVLGWFHLADRAVWERVTGVCRWLTSPTSQALLPRRIACASFSLFAVALTIGLSWFPIEQARETGGILCYQNAFDEMSYLQYEFSSAAAGPNRSGQGVVQLGHIAGLSGGWINFVMDVGCLLGFILAARWLFRELGCDPRPAWLAAIGLALLPIVFTGGYNGWLRDWFYWLLESNYLYWFSAPQAWYLPLSRSPEPQFSLLLATANLALAVRLRSFWAAYACVPFLYPYILLPYLLCTLVLHLAGRPEHSAGRFVLALTGAFVLAGLCVRAQVALTFTPRMRDFLVDSRLPIVSTTGCIALGMCLLSWKLIEPRFRRAALLIGLAPTLVNNLQIVSGLFTTPHNFEQNAGVVCCGLVAVLAALPWLRYRVVEAIAFVGLALLAWSHGQQSFRDQQNVTADLRLTPELLTALREAPEEVVVDNPGTAGLLPLIYPRLETTPFGWQNTYGSLAQTKYPHYVHVRHTILADPQLAAQFGKAIRELDALYRYESADFILLHNGRRTEFPVKHVPESVDVPPRPARLRLFVGGVLVGRTGHEEAADPASRVSPSP